MEHNAAPEVGTRIGWIDNDGTSYFATVVERWQNSYGPHGPPVDMVFLAWDDGEREEWPWPHLDLWIVS